MFRSVRNGLFRHGRCGVTEWKNGRGGAERAFLWRGTVLPDVRKRMCDGAEEPFLRCGKAFIADCKCEDRTAEWRKRLCYRLMRDVRENGVFATWRAVVRKKESNGKLAMNVYSLLTGESCIFIHVFQVLRNVVGRCVEVCRSVAHGMLGVLARRTRHARA